jgi:hypothetical protein
MEPRVVDQPERETRAGYGTAVVRITPDAVGSWSSPGAEAAMTHQVDEQYLESKFLP